ncbi:hypothetical protein NKH77_47550 [Streptomyces sp. M19]
MDLDGDPASAPPSPRRWPPASRAPPSARAPSTSPAGRGGPPDRRPDRHPAAFDPAGTVLVTGATGVLGSLVARHLVTRHGCGTCCSPAAAGPPPPARPSWSPNWRPPGRR